MGRMCRLSAKLLVKIIGDNGLIRRKGIRTPHGLRTYRRLTCSGLRACRLPARAGILLRSSSGLRSGLRLSCLIRCPICGILRRSCLAIGAAGRAGSSLLIHIYYILPLTSCLLSMHSAQNASHGHSTTHDNHISKSAQRKEKPLARGPRIPSKTPEKH